MGFSIDMFIWNTLSKKSCLLFGKECGSVTVWVLITLLMKTILYLCRLEGFIARGFIFASPLVIQMLGKYIPILRTTYPIVTVRLAESLLGKVSPSKVMVIVPAHLLGSIVGIVMFKSVLPFIPNEIIAPIPYQSSWWLQNLIVEIIFNFIYITVLLVVPYLLEINRITTKIVSLPLVPLFLLKAPLDTCTFNPAIIYGLWYVNNCTSLLSGFSSLQSERIIGPIIGAILSGIFCNIYFPDDPNSWSRKRK